MDDNHTKAIDFKQVHWFADRAASAYQSAENIQSAYPDTVRVATVKGTDVQYFLEQSAETSVQVLTIRGTANLDNAVEDAEYGQHFNQKLGINVHHGFDADTQKVYADVKPFLDPDRSITLTGHSLGAAISTLMMMYLHQDGYEVNPSINFGQPKVTNKKGAKAYDFLPLTRMVDENDVVPLLPPLTLLSALEGEFTHFAPEVILLEGEYYVYADAHLQRESKSESFWAQLGDESVKAHFMKHYLHNIKSKLRRAQAISYNEREKYIDT